jgi:hypothetical protein
MLVRPKSPIIGDSLKDTVERYLSRDLAPILPRGGREQQPGRHLDSECLYHGCCWDAIDDS